LILAGKKSESYFRFRHYNIEAAFNGFSEQPDYEHAREIARLVIDRFTNNQVDQVQLIYTQFLSVGVQRVVNRTFLPLQTDQLEGTEPTGPAASYEFEPTPDAILERLLPRYVESRLFDAFLEAAASEHAARQRAMKSATDNAEELIKALSRQMNRARQDAITTEIMEIVSGAEALSKSDHDTERVDMGAATPELEESR